MCVNSTLTRGSCPGASCGMRSPGAANKKGASASSASPLSNLDYGRAMPQRANSRANGKTVYRFPQSLLPTKEFRMTVLAPPGPDEYGTYYAGYIAHVPAGTDILDLLARQRAVHPGALRRRSRSPRRPPLRAGQVDCARGRGPPERRGADHGLSCAPGGAWRHDAAARVRRECATRRCRMPRRIRSPALAEEWGDVRRATLSLLPPPGRRRRGPGAGPRAARR